MHPSSYSSWGRAPPSRNAHSGGGMPWTHHATDQLFPHPSGWPPATRHRLKRHDSTCPNPRATKRSVTAGRGDLIQEIVSLRMPVLIAVPFLFGSAAMHRKPGEVREGGSVGRGDVPRKGHLCPAQSLRFPSGDMGQ